MTTSRKTCRREPRASRPGDQVFPWFPDPPGLQTRDQSILDLFGFWTFASVYFGFGVLMLLSFSLSWPLLTDWSQFDWTSPAGVGMAGLTILAMLIVCAISALIASIFLWPILAFESNKKLAERIVLVCSSPQFGRVSSAVLIYALLSVLFLTVLLCGLELALLRFIRDHVVGHENRVRTDVATACALLLTLIKSGAVAYEITKTARRRVSLQLQSLYLHPVMRSEGFLIAHLSDLHVTETDTTPRTEYGPNANRPLRTVLSKFRRELSAADAVLATGDLTDAGTGGDWMTLFSMLQTTQLHGWNYKRKLILTPGNHDLNIFHPTDYLKTSSPDQVTRKLRQIRFLYALRLVQGSRTNVCTEEGWVPLVDFMRPWLESLERFRIELPERQVGKRGVSSWDYSSAELQELLETPTPLWSKVFPLVAGVQNDRGEKLRIVILDTNDHTSTALTNAFGHISEGQVHGLRRAILRCRDERVPIAIAMHHHLGRRAMRSATINEPQRGPVVRNVYDRVSERFMGIANAPQLLEALDGLDEVVVFHGHRHGGFEGSALFARTRIHIISAPSTTLGDAVDTSNSQIGFNQIRIVASPGGGSFVTSNDTSTCMMPPS